MHNFSNKLQLISYDKTNILVNYAPLCSTMLGKVEKWTPINFKSGQRNGRSK